MCVRVCVSTVYTVLKIEKCCEVCILNGVYCLRAIFTAESMPYGGQYVQGGFLISCRDGKGYCVLIAGSQIQKLQVNEEISVDKFNEA